MRHLLSSVFIALFILSSAPFSAASDKTTAQDERVIQVFGHASPDTDTVVGAIALAELQNRRGMPSRARVQGKLNPETAFVMRKFNLPSPSLIEDVTGMTVSLVDFSDVALAPKGMEKSAIVAIVDHHKLGDVTTSEPLEMWVWPTGSSNTVLKAMYDFYGVAVPRDIAGAMVCAILSDTVMFKSPTTTARDREAVKELAAIAGIDDVTALGMDMFRAKSDLSGSAKGIFTRDYKEFDMSGRKIGIGQLELMDKAMVDPLKSDLYKAARSLLKERNCHTVMLLVTDIMKEGTQMLVVSSDIGVIERAFGVKFDPRDANDPTFAGKQGEKWIPGMMSRKKQVLPPLMKTFKEAPVAE